MPNWCFSTVVFYTNQENVKELHRLHDELSRIMETKSSVENDFGNSWLGNVAAAHGLDYNKVRCRGTIDSIDDFNVKDPSFSICTSTAWGPTPDLWDAVCNDFQEIDYVYCAEEDGCQVYVNTDQGGVYLEDRFLIDSGCCDDLDNPLPEKYFLPGISPDEVFGERSYYSSFSQLQSYMERITGKKFVNLKQIEDYLNKALAVYRDDEDSFINIHEFSYS